MIRTLRPFTWARSASGLALLCGVAACRAPGPVKAVPGAPVASSSRPIATGGATSAAAPAPARPPGPATAAGSDAVDPHGPHPALLALVRRLSEWSPRLASRLPSASLADTAGADSERTQTYLVHLVAQRLLLPTLRLSADPTLSGLGESIESSTLFGLYSVGTRIGMTQDTTPSVCNDCQRPDCSLDYRCQRELERVAPVGYVEDGLGFFDPLCDEEHDFPWWPSCELSLERYLEATVTAGLARRRVEDVAFQIVLDVAKRCRTIERPPSLDPHPLVAPAQVLERAYSRWRGLYGASLRGEPLIVAGAVPSPASSDDAETAVRRFECRMYGEVPTARSYARELEGYHAAEVASRASADESDGEPDNGASQEPLEEPLLECDFRRGRAERACRQVDGGVSGVRSALDERLESLPPPPELVTELALALESLSLAGVSPRALDEQYRLLARRLTASKPGER